MLPVTVKFNHWIPKLLKMGATTIGHTIYIARPKAQDPAMRTLFKHECLHCLQVEQAGGTIPFLWQYFVQWIKGGFKYGNIQLEKDAYLYQTFSLSQDEYREWLRWFV